jgi:hypothetical protein
MESLPKIIPLAFIFTTIATVYFFYRAIRSLPVVLFGVVPWLLFQMVISLLGFYQTTGTMPPRFAMAIVPPLVIIVALFLTDAGRKFIDKMDMSMLTLLHVVRIPVELVLFQLFAYSFVPEVMTFEGRNFDILSGLTAPVVYYYGYIKKSIPDRIMIVWNVLCLALLVNVVVHAALALPSPLQQIAFDQPNRAVLYYPFIWLPACVVPLVLLAHLVTLRQLLSPKINQTINEL